MTFSMNEDHVAKEKLLNEENKDMGRTGSSED